MTEIKKARQRLMELKGEIAELPKESQGRVARCAEEIKRVIGEYNEGNLALLLVFFEHAHTVTEKRKL